MHYVTTVVNYARLSSGLPLVREKSGKIKVREKSGNFLKSQANLGFKKKLPLVREISRFWKIFYSCGWRNADFGCRKMILVSFVG